MAENDRGTIKLDPGGRAPVLSYNVPDPTSYSGRNFIDLRLPAGYFRAAAGEGPSEPSSPALGPADLERTRARLAADGEPLAEDLRNLDPSEVEEMRADGKEVVLYRTLGGEITYRYLDASDRTTRPLAATAASRSSLGIGDGAGGAIDFFLSIYDPAENARLRGPHTGARIEVSGGVEVAYGKLVGGVQVKVGSRPFVEVGVGDDGSWSHVAAGVSETGQISITAQATARPDGSRTTVGRSATRRVFVTLDPPPDTAPPSVAIDAPNGGAPLVTSEQRGLDYSITGTASDTGGSGTRQVEVSLDGAGFQQAGPRAPDDWSRWSIPLLLAPGNHTIRARAIDKAGNVSAEAQASAVVKLVVPDRAGPVIHVTSPQQGAGVTGALGGAVVVVEGTVSDAGGSGIDEGHLVLDGHENSPAELVPKRPGDWSAGFTGSVTITDPGAHHLKARFRDGAGNWGESAPVLVEATIVPEVVGKMERLILVESYRLSSYLGNYGMGRTIKTFSLLPGEKTKMSVKSYAKKESTAKSASSVLDSYTTTSARNFERSMGREQSDKKSYDESFKYNVEGKAEASWGWGNASVGGGVSGGSNAAREEFAKNISNAVEKHAAEASAKRDVQVNTSYEVKEEASEETSIEREIENINVSRTLNFVVGQMNQEFVSILHLVDVRVGYFRVESVVGPDGATENKYHYREASLPQLESLLREVIVDERRQEVMDDILAQLNNVFDYKDAHHRFTERKAFLDADGREVPGSGYLRVKKGLVSTYRNGATGTRVKVPGIIMAAKTTVLRTEGLMCEAMLGQGDALDSYSQGLQDEAVRARELANERALAELERERLAQRIVEERDEAAAALFERLFRPDPEPSETVSTEGVRNGRRS